MKNTWKPCLGCPAFKSYIQAYCGFARVDEVRGGELKSAQGSLPSGFARKVIIPI